MSYLIRYSDKYKKVVLYKAEVLDSEQKNLSRLKYKLRITYKNETKIINLSERDYSSRVGRKEKVMSSWINNESNNSKIKRSFRLFRRYICWFYPEELL